MSKDEACTIKFSVSQLPPWYTQTLELETHHDTLRSGGGQRIAVTRSRRYSAPQAHQTVFRYFRHELARVHGGWRFNLHRRIIPYHRAVPKTDDAPATQHPATVIVMCVDVSYDAKTSDIIMLVPRSRWLHRRRLRLTDAPGSPMHHQQLYAHLLAELQIRGFQPNTRSDHEE